MPLAPEPDKLRAVWTLLDQAPIVVDERISAALTDNLASIGLPGARLLHLGELRRGAWPAAPPDAKPDDLALVQFSSGSTGAPKGVELTHANLLANLEQSLAAGAFKPGDVMVSWMPYFHDMGLIGTHLLPLFARVKQVKIGPLEFVKAPALWFDAIARHRATVSTAASFALALTVKRVPDERLAGLDLSSLRLLAVGAEPISARMWRSFLTKLRPARIDPRALQPVYGLAEATMAVASPPAGELAIAVARRPRSARRRAGRDDRAW